MATLAENKANHQPKYKIGEYYRTLEGKVVKVVDDNRTLGYECVKGDDGVWRYDRYGKHEDGRVTGSNCYPPDPRNFVNGSWLKYPQYILALSNGYNPSRGTSNKWAGGNITHIEFATTACKEIDRLQDKIMRLQKHYESIGGCSDEVRDILYK